MERFPGSDFYDRNIEMFMRNYSQYNGERFCLNGEYSLKDECLGIMAIYPSVTDIGSYEEVYFNYGKAGELQSLIKSIQEPDKFPDIAIEQKPQITRKMVKLSIEEQIPLAVLLVSKPKEDPSDATIILYCLNGFNPKHLYNIFREDSILFLYEKSIQNPDRNIHN